MSKDIYCPSCGSDVAQWGHDDGCRRAHDPVVKGKGDDCWVICHECGFDGLERPDEYTDGVLKISTSRANANRIAKEHRRNMWLPAAAEERVAVR